VKVGIVAEKCRGEKGEHTRPERNGACVSTTDAGLNPVWRLICHTRKKHEKSLVPYGAGK
jgi:hypothetical protein